MLCQKGNVPGRHLVQKSEGGDELQKLKKWVKEELLLLQIKERINEQSP